MNSPIVIDVEASGFGAGSYPIEVGYVNEEGKTWCALIAPQDGWVHWDPEAEKLHQVSRETLRRHGKDAAAVAAHLNDVFQNKTVYTDAWMNDFTWMNLLFEVAGMQPHFKLEDLRSVLTDEQQAIWHEEKQAIMDELKLDRHRASTDAKVIQLTWVKTSGENRHLTD
ncbi:MAG TPA: hypothetical protein VGJ90_08935 [Methylophilaceae bacterium]|jgi:hypothetical protein